MVSKKLYQWFFMRMIISFVLLFSCVASAMEQAIIPHVDDITWKLFFTHNRDVLPYEDEHAFAQTSFSNCALISTVQDQRKNVIHNYISKSNLDFSDKVQFVYHRSWRILGAIDIIPQEKEDKDLLNRLRMLSLKINDNGSISPKIVVWDNFIAPLPHNPPPFFNKNKELCFYGFQKSVHINPACYHKVIWQGVIEYTTSEQIPCELLCPGPSLEPLHIQLVEFLKFPVLLKNILDSYDATMRDCNNYSFSHYKSYYIGKVFLSHDYRQFQEFPCGGDLVKRFSDLSQNIRNVLARRYRNQPKAEQ